MVRRVENKIGKEQSHLEASARQISGRGKSDAKGLALPVQIKPAVWVKTGQESWMKQARTLSDRPYDGRIAQR